MRRRSAFACLLLPLCLAAPSRADMAGSDELPTVVMDTLDVVADRPSRIELIPTFATLHDAAGLLDRVSSVTDVVEQGAGVHVRRYGGLGAYSTASIRASSPGQVEVYVDGVPMNSAQWGATDLSDLPLQGLERIEVYRGGAPVEFGSAGIGGVVNLVTRCPGRRRSAVALSCGSHETFRIDMLQSRGSRALDCSIAFQELQSKGDFEYLDRHGTPENDDDDEIVRRENNDFKQSDILVRVDARPAAGWRVEASGEAFSKRSGVPGIENVHIASVHYKVFRNTARLAIEPPPLAGGDLSLRVSGFHVFRRDLFYNPEDEVGFDRADTDDRSWSYGANAMAQFHWPVGRQSFSLFAESRRERHIPESMNPSIGVGFTRKRAEVTCSAEDRFFVPGGRVELVAGYRYHATTDNYAGPIPFGAPPEPLDEPHRAGFGSPSLGLRLVLNPRATLKANWTRYARFPSMVELFGASGYVQGNTELSPERGTTADVGVTLRSSPSPSGETFFEIACFRADRSDLIVFLQNSQRTVKASNLESAEVLGVEVTARRSLECGLALSLSYTFQDARNTGPSPTYEGKRLPYEPAHDLFLRTEWENGRFAVWHEYHLEGEAYRDRANLPENLSPASEVHNVGVRLGIVPGALALSLEVLNVTDERITDVEGYPLPGRVFYATLVAESL